MGTDSPLFVLGLAALLVLPGLREPRSRGWLLLYLWLRLRTGSLLLPVVVHNLWNLSVYVAHP